MAYQSRVSLLTLLPVFSAVLLRLYTGGGVMAGATTIFLVCSGFVFLATDPDRRRPINDVSLTIDLRAGRVSGFSKGTIEKTSTPEQIGWVDPECPNISANGVFDRVTGETHTGVCVGDRDKPGLDYYVITCVPARR